MSGNPDDPDFSSVPASLPGPVSGSSATGTNLAQLRADMATMAETNKGSAINAAGARIAEIAAAGRALELNLAIVEAAAKEQREAKAAWEKASEGARKVDLDAADEAVQAAKTKLAQAQTIENSARDAVNAAQAGIDACEPNTEAWYDAMRTWSAACTARDAAVEVTKAAQTALDEARKKATDLKQKSKNAFADLRRAYQRIADKLKSLDRSVLGGGRRRKSEGTTAGGGLGSGPDRPGTTHAPGEKPAPRSAGSSPTTAGAGKGGKEMPSMPSTPAKPTETGSTGSGKVDPQSLLTAAALLNGQQQQQQPQAATAAPQQAQATPQQTAPTQEQKKPGEKSELEKQAEKNGSDFLRIAAGEDPEKVLGGSSPLTVAPAVNTTGPQSAPSNQHGTTFRPAGTPITGTTSGGNQIPAQPAPTTGHSVTGMNTKADVTGSSTPSAGAFDSTKTNTSAAHGTATEQQQTQQQRAAGAPVGGIPHAMAPGAAASGGAPRTRDKDDLVMKGAAGDGGLDQGQTAVSEAVPGGTICQNKPDTSGKAA
ncbi:hypothetical protein [Mycobacteroides abscessus]|uniref:hypothetical protein n=1 Tax=Mycobacteroides abscessus TaxID=36809 RepID=UPI00267097E6|nr:hypothetical protein [Mycobacteroides abscessus]MDO3110464.1 hypothetical protein [Mycobacteroides abscessus subsp. abscessus]